MSTQRMAVGLPAAVMRALTALTLLLIACATWATQPIPPVARVTDQTGTLAAAQRQALETKLADFERAKGSQIAVLIVPTTQPETIEQYALRVFDAWKLGRKGVDDGLLVVVAKQDRTVRIEVGYGLEGAIPDAIAARVMDEFMVPRFREGDMPGGIYAGIDRLIDLVNGEALPAFVGEEQDDHGALVELFVMLMLTSILLSLTVSVLMRKLPSLERRIWRQAVSAIYGCVAGGFMWWLVDLVFASLAFALLNSGVMLFWMYVMGLKDGTGGSSIGGGSFGSRSGSDGSSGSDGFSGGGGRSGGGGASGRW